LQIPTVFWTGERITCQWMYMGLIMSGTLKHMAEPLVPLWLRWLMKTWKDIHHQVPNKFQQN